MLGKMNRYWRAANYLCIGRIYLCRESLAARASQGRADQTKAARALGNFTGTKPHLRPSESADKKTRCEYHLYCRSGSWRSIAQRQLLSRRHLYRSPSGDYEVSEVVDEFNRKLYEHHDYIRQNLEDMPEIRNWQWTADFSEPSAPPPLAKGHPRARLFSDS